MHQRLVLVYAVDHQSSTPPDIVDAVIRQLLHSSGLHDDVEAIWVILLEFLPLRVGVLAVKLEVFITGIEFFCDIHLDTLVGRNHDAGCTVLLEKLCKDETSWACAQKKDFDANTRVELVQSVDSACSGL